MDRLNLTLDDDTAARLRAYASEHGTRTATAARELLVEALDARQARARRRKLIADYARGRDDAAELLRDLEPAQLDFLAGADE